MGTDVDSFILGAQALEGYSGDRLIKLMDPTHNQLGQMFFKLSKTISAVLKKAEEDGRIETIAVLCYVAGHGIQDGYNHIVLNEAGDLQNTGQPAKS